MTSYPVAEHMTSRALPHPPASPPSARARENIAAQIAAPSVGATHSFDVDSAGCVVSYPGAPDQHFHPDGTATGLVNAFIALEPVTRDNGPTELRPGSHVWVESAAWGPQPRWDERRGMTARPELGCGDMLLFDYRTYHRGTANRTDAPRPIGYLVYARSGVADTHNFPAESLVAAATMA